MPPVKQPSTNGTTHDPSVSPLKIFEFHGVDLRSNGSGQSVGECPFCVKGKFHVNESTGLWDCKVCGEKGNNYGFLRALHKAGAEQTTESAYAELAVDRGIVYGESLRAWGVVKSPVTGEWLVPGWGVDGKLNQLYKYVLDGKTKKRRLYASPDLGQYMAGVNLYEPKKPDVILCEGVWDGIALWESLRSAKSVDGALHLTGAESSSLLASVNVLTVPGCQSFPEGWGQLLHGKRVTLMYDSDHPRQVNGKTIEPAGWLGMKKVAGTLAVSEWKPETVSWLAWGPDGFDPHHESGTDVRDLLRSNDAETVKDRIENLAGLLKRVEPIPDSWVAGKDRKAAKGKLEIAAIPCDNWKTVVNALRRCMQSSANLEGALAFCLAVNASTNSVGDQLWGQLLSPPSCLDGDTPIYDPVDGTTVSVRDRCSAQKPFHVYSRNELGEVIVTKAEAPKQYPISPMFKVSMKSGATMRVTGGHRVWTGAEYVSIDTIFRGLHGNASYRLPTISEPDLSIRARGVPRCSRTVQDSLSNCCACFCHGGGQLPLGEGSDRVSLPSRDGAQGHIRAPFDRGGSVRERRCTLQLNAPLSTDSNSHREGSLRYGDECVPSLLSGTYERSPSQSSSAAPSPERKGRSGRVQPSWQYGDATTAQSEVHDRLPEHIGQSVQLLLGNVSRIVGANILEGSIPPSRPFGIVGLADVERGEFEPRLREGIFESRETPPTSASRIRLGSCRTGTGERPLDGVPSTTVLPSSLQKWIVGNNTGTDVVSTFDEIANIELDGEDHYYDFHVPETENYWACGYFHHNTGKSTLAEAMSINTRHIVAKSTIRGMHSGFQTDADGKEDHSLLSKLNGKTLIIKDGDTLLQAPNLPQILSEMRDVYDRVSRTSYRNKASRDYIGVSCTILIMGTGAMRVLDTSELGERFLKYSIMDGIDPEMERDIVRKVLFRQSRIKGTPIDEVKSLNEPDMTKFMQLVSGYIDHLAKWANPLLQKVDDESEEALERLGALAVFVSYLRARPSPKQVESVERELAARLASQLHRLATCLAVVLNKTCLDDDVMRLTAKVAMDTSKGRTLEIVHTLYKYGDQGIEAKSLSIMTAQSEAEERNYLKFLKKLGAVEVFANKVAGVQQRPRWRLTPVIVDLYREILQPKEEIAI